jgi:aquaporin Z
MKNLCRNYPEYLMEAAGLGIFMISAAVVTAVVEHPASPIRQTISEALLRRFIIGMAMGLTAIAIIYSPWGKQSGAHINPVVTFTFLRLGKIKPTDALFYILAQFVGGMLGLLIVVRLLGEAIANPSVNYVITTPGAGGARVAFSSRVSLSFGTVVSGKKCF